MAVKTRLTDNVLARIVSQYDIGTYKSSKPFKEGYVQTNILIITDRGKHVLRYYEEKNKETVMFEAELLEHLSNHDYPCTMPIKNRSGDIIGMHNNKPYIIFSYIPGRHIKNINSIQLYDMVKHLAMLHNTTKGYKPAYHETRQPRTKEFCLNEAMTESKRFKDTKEGRYRLYYIKEKLNTIRLPTNLPKGIIHGDFDSNNIKFRGNNITGILDFDDATYAILIYDIGMMLLYWTRFYLKTFNHEKARSIIRVYEKYRPLTRIERRHIYDALQLHALMIMAWLMYDKWKGKDLFIILAGIIEELESIGREEYYNKLFG
ncbi:MAG: homoserine kinase [Candidatus Woesearchaeota archaeon]